MPNFTDDIKIEYDGSPKLRLYSRGNGTQEYSIRSTNDSDGAGGARFIVRNESSGADVLTITDGRGAAVGIGTSTPAAFLHISRHERMPRTPQGQGFTQTEVIVDNTAQVDTGIGSGELGRSESKLTLRSRTERLAIPISTPLATAEGSILVIAGSGRNTMLLNARDVGMSITFATEGNERLRIAPNGNVGIGTPTPDTKLDIREGDIKIEYDGSPKLRLYSRGNGTQEYSIRSTNDSDGAGGARFIVRNETYGTDVLTITGGRGTAVGIGTTTPEGNLHVVGTVVADDVVLTNADCAEEFDVDPSQALDPGTVMVISDEEALHPCTDAYDKRVAGVISGAGDCRPGIVLGRQPSPHQRLPLALSGKVYCKVDTHYAPIEVGDLLTTSSTPGHAMKATDPLKAFGAVIGKALRPLKAGQGLIPILVALQ